MVSNVDGWLGGSCLWLVVVYLFVVFLFFFFMVLLVIVDTSVWVTVKDVCSVWEFSSSAGKNISACADEVWSEGELLAVENKDISVFILCSLGSSAPSLEVLNPLFLVRDLIVV